MNLVKTTLAIATAAVVSAPSFAADAVSVYGKVNLSLESADVGGSSETGLYNAASRLGFKGGAELADGLKVVYKYEFEVNVTDDKDDTFGKRNQYVGLEGNFGQVLIGRNDTMLKQSQGKVDLFSDLQGDIKKLWEGENRIGETVTYKSPSFSGVTLGATLALANSTTQAGDKGYSLAAMYGDKKLKKTPVYASVAYDSDVANKKGVKYDILRATVQGKVAGVKLGAMYQTQEKDGGSEDSGFMVNAAYTFDAVTAKVQYQELEDKDAISVGADYKLAKPTKLFAYYISTDKDDADYVGIGIEHKF